MGISLKMSFSVLSAASLMLVAGSALAATPAWTIDQVQHASAIVEGASGKAVRTTIYVFMDPNCIYCHYAWKSLQPYEAEGLQVHWIPLGFLKPDSAGKAAALLQAADGAALLHTLETNYSEKDESGGIAPLTPVPAAAQTKIDANTHLFTSAKFEGTPTIIYKDATGKWLDMDGFPKLRNLPQLLNLPAQPVTDPDLKKFY